MTPQERAEFIHDVTAAIKAQEPILSDDEQRWVRMAIKKEAQTIAFRQAVIEKTLGGLAWAAILMMGYLAMEFLRSKGFKP